MFDFEEGTRFLVIFDNNHPKFEVWIENGVLMVEQDEYILDVYDGDNRAVITKQWLKSTFILKNSHSMKKDGMK